MIVSCYKCRAGCEVQTIDRFTVIEEPDSSQGAYDVEAQPSMKKSGAKRVAGAVALLSHRLRSPQSWICDNSLYYSH